MSKWAQEYLIKSAVGRLPKNIFDEIRMRVPRMTRKAIPAPPGTKRMVAATKTDPRSTNVKKKAIKIVRLSPAEFEAENAARVARGASPWSKNWPMKAK